MIDEHTRIIRILDNLYDLIEREYLAQSSAKHLGVILLRRINDYKAVIFGLKQQKDSVYQQRLTTSEGRLDLAATELESKMFKLLAQAQQQTGISVKELATAAKTSNSRVSQIFDGDANIRISTLSRLMAAMGYEVILEVKKMEE